jgi:hypothetical protein
MEIITKNKLKKLTLSPRGKFRKSNLIEMCSKMKIGQILFFSHKEWKGYGYAKVTTPTNLVHTATYQTRPSHKSKISGKKFSVYRYIEGWVIIRKK